MVIPEYSEDDASDVRSACSGVELLIPQFDRPIETNMPTRRVGHQPGYRSKVEQETLWPCLSGEDLDYYATLRHGSGMAERDDPCCSQSSQLNLPYKGTYCRCCGTPLLKESSDGKRKDIIYCSRTTECPYCYRTLCGPHYYPVSKGRPLRRFCENCKADCNPATGKCLNQTGCRPS